MNDDIQKVRLAILHEMNHRNLSYAEVGTMIVPPMHRQAVREILVGEKAVPKPATLNEVAQALGMTVRVTIEKSSTLQQ